MQTLPTDFLITGERERPGVFDTDRAREAGVFELAHATWGGKGVDADMMKMRLNDIDHAIMAGTRDGLVVNSQFHVPHRDGFVPSRNPVPNVTPATSASWDGPRDPQGAPFRIAVG